MADELDKAGIAKAYARWAPIYDLVFGAVFERGRKASIARCVSETAPRVSPEPPAILLSLICSIRRNTVATESAALSEPARTRRNDKPL